MKHKNRSKKLLIVLALLVLVLTGCTVQLKDSNNKIVTNPKTG